MNDDPGIRYSSNPITTKRATFFLLVALLASLLVVISPSVPTAIASAPTCAQGGLCALGDTGPGGGKVFYADVTPSGFDELYAPCSPHCHYLEAAPTVGTNRWMEQTYVWSPNTFAIIGGTDTSLGTGYANTLMMIQEPGSGDPAVSAGAASQSFRGPNALSDWFLPSKDELRQLYLYRGVIDPLMINGNYWSSTEAYGSSYPFYLALQYAPLGLQDGLGFQSNPKSNTYYVRPIRAFSPNTASPVIRTPTSNQIITGTVGVPLTFSFSLSGNAPFEVRASKPLPTGLAMNLEGVVSGTPTVAGTTTLSFEVVDSNLGSATSVNGISFVISSPPTLMPAFTLSATSETATVGTAITGYSIVSSGGTVSSYSISPDISATPRNGISFNTTTGLISGTPTAAAAPVQYTITGTNSGGSASRTFTLLVHTFACTGGGYDVTGGVASNGSSCTGSLTLDSSVTSIAANGFDTSTVTSLTIPNSVLTIGASAFGHDSALTVLNLGNSLTSIGAYAFTYAGLTSLVIPNTVTSIGDGAFYASPLTTLRLGSGVTTIGIGAFRENYLDCRGFTNLSSANLTNAGLEYASSCGAVVLSPTNNQIITGRVGTPFSFYFSAAYGGATSVATAGALPPGLSIGSYGLISGTPTTAGTTTLSFSVQDIRNLPATIVSGVTFVIAPATEAVASTPAPDPVQQSKITSISPTTAAAGNATSVVVSGTFIEKISSIQINGVALPSGSWVQTSTTVSFTVSPRTPGSYQIQLYNGSAPVMKVQNFTISTPADAKTSKLTAKPKVTYIRCVKPGHGTRIAYGINPSCPAGYTKK